MSHKHTRKAQQKNRNAYAQLPLLALATLAVGVSFSLGLRSANDVETISVLEAHTLGVTGDMNEDGTADILDAIIILEIAQGYNEPTANQLKADPNGDGQLTVDDALRILHDAQR